MHPTAGQIYLAKGNTVSGPFTPAQLLAMESSGEISEYDWVWDPEKNQWRGTREAPPPPTQTEVKAAPSPGTDHLLAICHDFRHLLSGKIEAPSAEGCRFQGLQASGELSPFRAGAVAYLNLLDESAKRSETVAVSVVSCKREEHSGHWLLDLSWGTPPTLLG